MKQDSVTSTKLAFDYVVNFLKNHYVANAENVSKLIISDVLGMPFSKALLKKPMLTQAECDAIDPLCDRVAQGEPVQYVLGHAYFRYLDLHVDKNVLIPRPETEMIVDIATYHFKENSITHPFIADIGTGSGCLAISFASEIEGARVYATDISKNAIEVAKQNAKMCGASKNITFECCSCLDNFDYYQHSKNQFCAIVTNPPYVPTDCLAQLPTNVKNFEPRVALDGGPDGLDVFREILRKCLPLLDTNGLFLCELSEESMSEAKQIAQKSGLDKVFVIKDLAKRDRFLAGIR